MKTLFSNLIILLIPIALFSQSEDLEINPLIFISYCNEERESVEKPIVQDWVDTDLEILKQKINPLPEIGNSIANILKLIPHFKNGKCNCNSSTQNYDLELNLSQHTIYGGYGSFQIDVLHFKDKVLKMRISLSNDSEIIENYLLKEIKLPFKCQNDNIIYEKVYSDNLEFYRTTKGKLFLESEDSIELKRNAVNYFLDVYSGGEFIKPYYFNYRLGSRTFDHLRYFIVNEDVGALETILFSPSPTSRLLAARTLIYLQERNLYNPSKIIKERIDYSISKSEKIRSGILSCWVGKFEYDYYDIVNNFEEYLKEE